MASVERNLTDAEREARALARAVGRVDEEAKQVDTTTKSIPGTFESLEKTAKRVVAAFAAIGVGQLFGAAIRGANAAIQSFAQLEDSINAVNVVFDEGAASVLEFGQTAAQSAGLSQSAFNQAVVPIGSLLQNFGFDAREAAEASVVLVQRAADLASVLGGSVQDALLAVGAALRGEADPLERYGASISAARVEQFALANGLAATKAQLTPAILLQARYGLILSDTAAVANDFANTSDDLANAQRIAAASVQDFVAQVGEQLAPTLSVLVGLLPEVLEGLRQLVPGFANAAGSAGEFFESVNEGVGGFRAPIQAIGAGLGLFGDSISGIGDVASGVFSVLQLDFDAAGDQATQFAERFARASQRIIGQNLARQLDAGTDGVTAFGNAISAFGRQEENMAVFAETFRTFAIQANLSGEELQVVTSFLIDNAAAAGLSADEVGFLREQLALLNDALTGVDVGAQRTANRVRDDLNEAFNTTTTTFTTFTNGLEGLPERMNTVAIEMRTAADKMGEALNPFEEAAEDIDVSAEEFFDRLIEEINEQATFQAGIAELILRKQFALAEFLGDQGPEVQEALTGFLEDVDLAAAADAGLRGEGTAFSNEIGDTLTAAIASGDLTPEVEQAFIDMLDKGIFSNSQVSDAIVTGTASQASDTATGYFNALGEEIDAFDASILQEKLGNLFAGVTFDIDASQFNFPDSGEFQGTIGVGAVLTPAPPITGTTGGTPSGTAFGGFTYAPTINNPVVEDLETTLAKDQQIMGSVAGILNGNFKL